MILEEIQTKHEGNGVFVDAQGSAVGGIGCQRARDEVQERLRHVETNFDPDGLLLIRSLCLVKIPSLSVSDQLDRSFRVIIAMDLALLANFSIFGRILIQAIQKLWALGLQC